MRCKPVKKGVRLRCVGYSLMIKLKKRVEKRKKGVSAVGVAYLFLMGSVFVLYSNFSLIMGKITNSSLLSIYVFETY